MSFSVPSCSLGHFDQIIFVSFVNSSPIQSARSYFHNDQYTRHPWKADVALYFAEIVLD